MKINIIKNSTLIFISKIIAGGLGLIISFLLVKLLGTEKFGLYNYLLAIFGLLLIPAQFGFEKLVTRNSAIYKSKGEFDLLYGFEKFSSKFVFYISVLIGLIAIVINKLLKTDLDPITYFLALCSLPIVAVTAIKLASLRGVGKILKSTLPNILIRPIIFFILLMVYYFSFNKQISLNSVFIITIISSLIVLCIVSYNLKNNSGRSLDFKNNLKYKPKDWLLGALPFLITSSVMVLNARTDKIIIGILMSDADVALYSVPAQLAQLIVFPLAIFNISLAPIALKSLSN